MTRIREPGPRHLRRSGQRGGRKGSLRIMHNHWPDGLIEPLDLQLADALLHGARVPDCKIVVFIPGDPTGTCDLDQRRRIVRATISTSARRQGLSAETQYHRLERTGEDVLTVRVLVGSEEEATSTEAQLHRTPS